MVTVGKEGEKDAARAEAALLTVRYKDGQPVAEADLERWLADDPLRAQAYLECEQVWNDLGQIAPDWGVPAPANVPARTFNRRQLAMSAMAACATGLVVGGVWAWQKPDYVTAIGEQRTVRLPDGSRVILNTDTQLKLDFRDDLRLVRLLRGEALFDVSHDASRPFVVDAGKESVRALGTRFVVRNETSRVEVILLSGSVEVKLADTPHGKGAYRLVPGDRMRRFVDQPVALDQPRIDIVTAWQRGELVLDDTPLDQAVAEMNRYSEKPIVVRSSLLKAENLSGVFRVGDARAFAQTIAAIYKLQLKETGGELVIS